LQVSEFFECLAVGALQRVEAGLEAEEAVMEGIEGVGEGVLALADHPASFFVEVVVTFLEVVGVEIRLGQAKAPDEPLVVDDGIDEIPLARGDGAELGEVFGSKSGEGFWGFVADDEGFGIEAGSEGVAARTGFAGLGTGAGGELRIAAIRGDLFFRCHK
jgi:hypothetical protein